jgi:apolipoprotein N-acyltransferase
MAERPMADLLRPGDPRSSARSSTIFGSPNDPVGGFARALLGAASTAVLFAFGALDPRLWACALIAPLPILAVAPEVRTEVAAELAFGAFLIGNLVAWGGESFAVPLMTMLASHVAGAIVFATFVACAAEATRRWSGVLAALVFPTFEVAFYYTLSLESPHGTWGSPAYSQVDFLPLLQAASWFGMCGVMFIMSLLPAGLAVAWYRRRWNMEWEHPAIMTVSVCTLVIMSGWTRVILTPQTPSVRVAMVASDDLVPESESTDPADAAEVLARYAKMVRQAASSGAQIVVTPAKIIGVAPSYEWDVVLGLQRVAKMSHVWLVVGLNQIGRTPKRNIAVVLAPDGTIVASYAKQHPIPVLESDYKAGSKPAIFDPPWGRTAVLISQDLDFPDTARELAAQDVRMVVSPAADWPGSEVIHQRMAVVRGVESGFSLARAARGGMLSASDSRGREIAAIESTNGADTIATANLPIGAGWTLYSRLDDLFGRLCVMFTILLMLRLAVSISYSIRTRQLGAAKRIKRPTGVVSVQVKHPEGEIERPDEPQERIYRPPVRPPE